jgi:FAD synthetase
MRLKMISALRVVDKAVLGTEGDMFDIVRELKPDIIALGFDQDHDEAAIKERLATMNMDAEVVRLPQLDHDLNGTRKIMRKVIDWYLFQERVRKEGGK